MSMVDVATLLYSNDNSVAAWWVTVKNFALLCLIYLVHL